MPNTDADGVIGLDTIAAGKSPW